MKRFVVLIFILGLGFAVFYLAYAAVSLPDFEALEARKVIESTKIFDRTGEILLYDIHGEVRRTVLPFDKIPRQMKNATVAIEDQNFYQHKGFSLSSILRALVINLLSGEVRQGGSTITQQLVKNTFLTSERTFLRKIKELILTLKVEQALSKDKILNLYLNEISYGASSYGIEAASQSYFAKSAEKLTLAEAAYLAALPRAPTRLSPYGTRREELEARKNLVLERMLALGFIGGEEFRSAKEEKVNFINRGLEGLRAPHFVMYVREYLVDKYGEDVVERGGLKVWTTLNWEWQKKAEELVRKFGEENEKQFNAKNAALAAVDPKTGQILVMVGSRDYFDLKNEGNFNATLARRQPGSAFKPFVYSAAFLKGFTPETVLFDLPTEFNPLCSPEGKPGPGVEEEKCYHPQNYDEKSRGPVTLREALAQSINLPSVKLLYLTGLTDALRLAKTLGISTLTEPERYGLTLVLGGGEVKLLEMVGAYAAFANEGTFHPVTPILKVENTSGEVLEEFEKSGVMVLEPEMTRKISGILSDNKARAPAFGERSALYFPERPVAVKTGTTNDYRDAWVIGYAPNIAAGVWAGNNDNTPMEKKVAGFIAAPLWNAFLAEIFKELPKEEFGPPAPSLAEKPILKGEWRGGRVYKIDRISGKLATEFTPEELAEEKVLREVHSILYWLEKKDDPQFKNWESEVRRWALAQGLTDETENVIPKEFDNLHRPEFAPEARFLEPATGNVKAGERLGVKISAGGKFPVEQIDLFWGTKYLGSMKKPPYEFSFLPEASPGEEGELSARIYDTVRNKTLITKTILVTSE